MPHQAHAHDFATICTQQVQALIRTLDDEQASLSEPASDQLEAVVNTKQELCTELAAMERALAEHLRQNPDDKLMELLRECQSKNQRNGELINQRRVAVQQRLGELDSGSSYSAQGKLHPTDFDKTGWRA